MGGKLGQISDHPWLVSLREEGVHKCGAVLIKPDKALTAAHCYNSEIAARSYSVYAGTNYRSTNGELVNVGRIYVHPRFSVDRMTYDLAVVWLLDSVTVGTFITPIAMAEPNEVLAGGLVATMAGWGYEPRFDAYGSFSEDLYQVDLPVLSDEECSAIYKKEVNTENMICAGQLNGNTDVTEGDSGGALVHDNKLYGIASWSSSKRVGIYTRVAAYRDWIDEAITEAYTPIYNDGY